MQGTRWDNLDTEGRASKRVLRSEGYHMTLVFFLTHSSKLLPNRSTKSTKRLLEPFWNMPVWQQDYLRDSNRETIIKKRSTTPRQPFFRVQSEQ
eukprot:4531136-Amphidinium_carterae.1